MPIVEVDKLTRVYGAGETAVTALDGVSLSVNAGEFVAIMGPSGCGKSTLLHLIGGLDKPDSGSVRIGDTDLSTLSDGDLTRLRRREIGFVFQFFNLIPVLSAVENAALPLVLDGKGQAEANGKAEEWLDKVGLSSRESNRPDQLSGGQQQRVAIARALSADPMLVLADEPTGNLDSKAADEVAGLLRQVASEWGRAVVMVTHDPRIAAFAHRLVVMKDGRVVTDQETAGDGQTAAETARLLVGVAGSDDATSSPTPAPAADAPAAAPIAPAPAPATPDAPAAG
jgi:putative ABC transport system ATP-binding protein